MTCRESTDSICLGEQEQLEFGAIQALWKPFEIMLWCLGLFLFIVSVLLGASVLAYAWNTGNGIKNVVVCWRIL